MKANEVAEMFLADTEIVSLAREYVSTWDNPDKETFNIPLYKSYIELCLHETCFQLGLNLANTSEFRDVLLQKLKGKVND